jgi:hypothetical protein
MIVDVYGQEYFANLRETHPDMATLSYWNCAAVLQQDAMGYSSAYATYLEALGQKVYEVVANFPEVQRRWAAENGLRLELTMADKLINRLGGSRRRRWMRRVMVQGHCRQRSGPFPRKWFYWSGGPDGHVQ